MSLHLPLHGDDDARLGEVLRWLPIVPGTPLWVSHLGPTALDRPFADDWDAAPDDAARMRVVIDQVASLTDASAVSRHRRLVGPTAT